MNVSLRWTLAALVGLALAIGLAWQFGGSAEAPGQRDETPSDATAEPNETAGLSDDVDSPPAGGAARYRLELDREEQVTLGAAAGESLFEGRLHLNIEFTRTPGEAPTGEAIEEIRFAAPTSCEAQLLGAPLVSTPAEAAELFRDRRLWRLADGDRAGSMRFPRDTPPLFRALASSVMAEIHVAPPPARDDASEWTRSESTPHGTAVSEYRMTTQGRDSLVRRKRAAYSTWNYPVEGKAKVSVDGAHVAVYSETGVLRRLSGQETLRAGETLSSESTVNLALVSLHPGQRANPSAEDWRQAEEWNPTRAPTSAETRRAMEEQRAAALSAESVLETLTTVGRGGTVPNHREWAWQAIGRLRLDDALCARIGQAMTDAEMTTAGRALMSDLLAQAGTPAAQRALLTALDSPALQADFGTLVSRLSLVPTPLPETVEWVRAASQSPDNVKNMAPLTLTLGAVTGALAKGSPGDATALRVAQTQALHLAESYRAAEDATSRALYLDALGNAGTGPTATIAAEAAQEPSASLRAGAARAVRKLSDEGSHQMLRDLAGDSNSEVQQQAFRALQRRDLTEKDWTHFGELAAQGAITDDGLGPLTTLLEQRASSDRAEISKLANQLIQQPTRRKDLHQRLLAFAAAATK